MGRSWTGCCQRCGAKSASYIMSMLNHELICPACKQTERGDSKYARAERADLRQYAKGLDAQGQRSQAANVRALAEQLVTPMEDLATTYEGDK